jgi:dimethylglycine dehydrogenase|tara:strand:+ start:1063 stop:3516 length:2454 start_codon:yes stop_codon:yes gene_type:complete
MSEWEHSHARVVVIGGGIAGASVFYHLAIDHGWTDIALVERDELTSGSTWHAAAQVTQFGANQTAIALKRHSIQLYKKLADDVDFPFAYHITGGMRLANTAAQVDTYEHMVGMANGMGANMEFIDPAEIARRHPLINPKGLLGAWWDPLDGDIDPAGITFAMVRKAREAGAKVYRFNAVENITRKANGEFIVHTIKGDITCEKVVNASGYRVNEVGNMLGVQHPVTSMEHMYFLTEPMAELEALDFRVPIIRDPRDDFYCRQEKKGLLVGVYEQGCKTFGMDGISPDFTKSLCVDDLDRCLDNMEGIFECLPALQNVGIHTIINGPITYTIDGAPLIGPVPGLKNAYCAIGLRAGIGESGGHGKILAEIIVSGQSEWDSWYTDPRRFTQYANTEHTCLKAIEDYQNEFHYHMPHEQRPAARLARTTPLYSVLDQEGAVWGTVNGWERVLMFKPMADFEETATYRFNESHAIVALEIAALQKDVGVMEVSGFNRYELKGEGVEEWLDHLACGGIPKEVGQVRLCYLLNRNGRMLCEATLAKLADNHFWYGSAAAAEWHDRDYLWASMPATVSLTEMASSHTILVLAGPKSGDLLQSLSPRCDWSAQAFGWMQVRCMSIGHAQVQAMSVSFSGELAYELHVPNEQLVLVWQLLQSAGETFNLSRFGLYAAESMRLEKGYLHWKADIIDEFNPMEAGLDRFVQLNKPDFVGKPALIKALSKGGSKKLVTLDVACETAPAHAGDPVFYQGKQVGTVTSGGYGHRVEKNLAYAYVDAELAKASQLLTVRIIGIDQAAKVINRCLYDPQNLKPRHKQREVPSG